MALDKEKFQRKYQKAQNALATLNKAVLMLDGIEQSAQCVDVDPDEIYKAFRDSLVQRFEYTFDLTWKYLSEYLKIGGRTIEIITPKSIFREGFKAGILSEDEVRQAIEMVDDRNLSTHGYDELLIEKIRTHIPAYAELLAVILKRTKIA